jgi:hypothetical protein
VIIKKITMMATSINTLPAIVNRKNFIVAYILLGPPHTPIIRYIGISITPRTHRTETGLEI